MLFARNKSRSLLARVRTPSSPVREREREHGQTLAPRRERELKRERVREREGERGRAREGRRERE